MCSEVCKYLGLLHNLAYDYDTVLSLAFPSHDLFPRKGWKTFDDIEWTSSGCHFNQREVKSVSDVR